MILISHNMPNVFEVSDRIHIARLGGCAGVIPPKSHTPTEAVAIMTRSYHAGEGIVSEPDLPASQIDASAHGRSRSWQPLRQRGPNWARPPAGRSLKLGPQRRGPSQV